MHVSLNWLKDYIQTDLSPEKIGEILTEIGLEVEGMEMKESVKGGSKGSGRYDRDYTIWRGRSALENKERQDPW